MILAHKLAGYIAAKALWSVKEEKPQVPLYGFIDKQDERHVEDIVADTLVDAVKLGSQRLIENSEDAVFGAMVFVGTLPIGKGEYDALFMEIRDYSKPEAKAIITVPFSPKTPSKTFRVHKLKVVEWSHCEDFDKEACLNSIFKGIEGHEDGFKLWRTSFDGSV
ncbi:MAG: hypothetical protein P1V97_01380 [Planctomycetota bacterium]|nr:hypothetical protein [Planctomycetota bacterium]